MFRSLLLTQNRAPLAGALLMTGAAQVCIQALGFVSGIVVLRNLSPLEYAYYTIVNTVLGAMTVLTDSGASSAVLTQGGKVWRSRSALGAVLSAGLYLRRRLAVIAAAAGLPALLLLLHRQGASWIAASVIAASAIPSFALAVSAQLLEIIPRLHQQIAPLQRIQLLSNTARAALLGIVIRVCPFAAAASIIAAIPQGWANWQLRRFAAEHSDWRVAVDPAIKDRLLHQIGRAMPAAIYFAISGQITVWLIATFGGADNVATVGALGRLAAAFSVLSTIFAIIAIPRYARIAMDDVRRVRRRFWQMQICTVAACALPLAALWIAPHSILAILGPHYSEYTYDALLMAAVGAVGVMNAAALGLSAARGVITPPWFSIPFALLGQIALIAILPISTVSGVLWLGLLSGLSQWGLAVAYFDWKTRPRTHETPKAPPASPMCSRNSEASS